MTSPQFEASEIFTCIEMEKDLSYIVVEGHEPDIYDNALRGLLQAKNKRTPGWLVVSGSDKKTILNFHRTSKAKNFFVILDRDFEDAPEQLERVSYLDRYSIENYLLDDMVIRQTAARLYKKAADNIELNLSQLVEHYRDSLEELLGYLISYQRSENKRNIAWSEQKILNKNCWSVCEGSILDLINNIKNDHIGIQPTDQNRIKNFIKLFPGKLLVKGIYYFLKKQINPPKFTATFNNESAFLHSLLANMEYSEDFVRCLDESHQFLLDALNK